jgi:hypothetical protein
MSTNIDVKALLSATYLDGKISQAAYDVLSRRNLIQIEAAIGSVVPMDSDEVALIMFVVDKSGSIDQITAGPQAVCSGHRLALKALRESSPSRVAGMLVLTQPFPDSNPLEPFEPVKTAIELNLGINYEPDGTHTPLYESTVLGLATLIAKMRQLQETKPGVKVRCRLIIITDGLETDNRPFTANDVKTVVEHVMPKALQDGSFVLDFVVCFVGITGEQTAANYLKVAESMGIQAPYVWTPDGASEKEIRKAIKEPSTG